MDKKDAKYFVSAGYEVWPGENGGFLLRGGRSYQDISIKEMAAFTNFRDLLAYLEEGHSAYQRDVLMTPQEREEARLVEQGWQRVADIQAGNISYVKGAA